jgi:hypothetical protein
MLGNCCIITDGRALVFRYLRLKRASALLCKLLSLMNRGVPLKCLVRTRKTWWRVLKTREVRSSCQGYPVLIRVRSGFRSCFFSVSVEFNQVFMHIGSSILFTTEVNGQIIIRCANWAVSRVKRAENCVHLTTALLPPSAVLFLPSYMSHCSHSQ